MLEVETYSGYKADERPVRFVWNGRRFEVTRILDRWREPDQMCFRVLADDGNVYTLRQHVRRQGAGEWTLTI